MTMKTKHDFSYGVVPFLKEADGWKVFLIYQYGSDGDIFWTFPKGHPEEGELPEEAAKREFFEETGLPLNELRSDLSFEQTYSFKYKDTQIDKTVIYYLGLVGNKNFTLQEDEVKDAGWFDLEEAKEKLTHDSARDVLAAAAKQLVNL